MGQAVLEHRKELVTTHRVQKTLLICGIISYLWYFAVNIFVPSQYPGYSITSQTVSELSAIDAPTRWLWVTLCIPFSLLLIAFGWGVWLSAGRSKQLRFVAGIIIFDTVFGSFWPPMHQREVIAAGGGTLTDTLHLVWTFVHLVFVLLMIIFSAAALGKRFRIYSILTIIIFIVFGILTSMDSPNIAAGKPTPYIGIWERINMGAYMLWIIVFAIVVMQKQKKASKI